MNASIDVEIPLYQLHHQVMGQSSYAWLSHYQGLLQLLLLGLVTISIDKLSLNSDEALYENVDIAPEVDSTSKLSVVACQSEPSSDRSSDRLYAQRWVVKSAAGGKEAGTQTDPEPIAEGKSTQYEVSQGRSTQNSLGWAAGATGGSDGNEPPEDGFGKEKFSGDPIFFSSQEDDDDEKKLLIALEDSVMYGGSGDKTVSEMSSLTDSSLTTISSTGINELYTDIQHRLNELQLLRSQRIKELSATREDFNREIKKLDRELRREMAIVNRRLQETIDYGERIKTLETQTSTINQETAQIAQTAVNAESNSAMNRQLININLRSINDFKTRLEGTEQRNNVFEDRLQAQTNRPQTTGGVTEQQFNELQDQVTALQIQVTEDQEMVRNHALPRADDSEIAQLRARVTVLEDEQKRLQAEANIYFYSRQVSGTFIFPISNFQTRRQEAISEKRKAIYTDPFWTPQGYKLCVRIFLNGDGYGKGQFISMFVVLMKGMHDSELSWPFQLRINLAVFNQEGGEHIISSFIPDKDNGAFGRPVRNMNIGSGHPKLFPLRLLDTLGYVKDDTMYFGVFIGQRE
ncbi:hypothetical protein [Endozoicomonas euniceicola]|uniref:MATH domain-containing protein n=1 Tax=Endozoicomonas euniceicola TaxID=1234143 RepID=A0ABY6GU28_9GAMM|nr:hypothetical protein [Endozoicomonas euniceicola]UYM15556.1 hypothetical protein NX720_22345 [Endozoicomonas euniceicola]